MGVIVILVHECITSSHKSPSMYQNFEIVLPPVLFIRNKWINKNWCIFYLYYKSNTSTFIDSFVYYKKRLDRVLFKKTLYNILVYVNQSFEPYMNLLIKIILGVLFRTIFSTTTSRYILCLNFRTMFNTAKARIYSTSVIPYIYVDMWKLWNLGYDPA